MTFWLGIALIAFAALAVAWAVGVFWSSLDALSVCLGISAVAIAFISAYVGIFFMVAS